MRLIHYTTPSGVPNPQDCHSAERPGANQVVGLLIFESGHVALVLPFLSYRSKPNQENDPNQGKRTSSVIEEDRITVPVLLHPLLLLTYSRKLSPDKITTESPGSPLYDRAFSSILGNSSP